MGVYIKDMEIPKENDYTIAIVYGDGVVTEYHEDYWIRGADGEKQLGTAVPVPTHGRLIDGDVAEVISFTDEDARGGDFADGVMYAVDFISEMPTIIEAEPEVHDCDNCKWFGGLMCDHVDENYKCLGWEAEEGD